MLQSKQRMLQSKRTMLQSKRTMLQSKRSMLQSKRSMLLDILFKLTPYSGHIDPPDDLVVYAA
jgi:hypothetical protein